MDPADTDLRTLVLAVHLVSGAAALLLAAVVMASGVGSGRRQDWTSRTGRAYVAAVCVVALSSLGLVTTGSTLPSAVQALLAVVAVCTAAAALYGQRLARRRPPDSDRWRPAHLRLMCGSVTSLVSAVAVVSAPPAVWVPVIVVCSSLTHVASGRLRAGAPPRWPHRAGHHAG